MGILNEEAKVFGLYPSVRGETPGPPDQERLSMVTEVCLKRIVLASLLMLRTWGLKTKGREHRRWLQLFKVRQTLLVIYHHSNLIFHGKKTLILFRYLSSCDAEKGDLIPGYWVTPCQQLVWGG